ncbi:MAG: Do family serine endopeptidase, partial [Rudaea sp.]
TRNPLAEDPLFRQFFGIPDMPQERVQQALGSGVIVDAEHGLILTNNHVVEAADGIKVTLADGRSFEAQTVGADPDTDVALVRIPASHLTALKVANSNQLQVGDFVVAVGNPFGLGQSVSSGIVSALGRSGLQGLGYQDLIQTDASINPGNSGGALVNLRGELVGINSAIFSPSGGNVGIGFAIPSNMAREVMQQLIATGTVAHANLGVQTQDLTPDIARVLGAHAGAGVVVTNVRVDSPAAAAGIKPGDVIADINGKPVRGQDGLRNAVGILPADSSVAIQLLREGKPLTVNARLSPTRFAMAPGTTLDARLGGAQLSEAEDLVGGQNVSGVRVNRVAAAGRAADNGLKPGDLIVGVNQVDINSMEDLKTLLAQHSPRALLSIVRGQAVYFLALH